MSTVGNEREPYIAILLFESATADSQEPPMYREDIVLVWAHDEDSAREEATRRADAEAGTSETEAGTTTLSLKQVVDVNHALDDDLTRDADLYSRHFWDYESYRRFDPLLSGEQ